MNSPGKSILRRLISNWPALLVVFAVAAVIYNRATTGDPADAKPRATALYPDIVDHSPLRAFKVVNAHEHLMGRKYLPKYFEACEKSGIASTLFVGSSEYTIMGAGHDQAKGNDENNAEIIAASKQYPDKIIAFCTIHPRDPAKLDKIKAAVAAGAKGLKLYTGHSNFYDLPLDDDTMMPVYEYCEQTALPICWHVNCPKFLAEFERVMQRYPRLVVIVPHFGVTFFRPRDAVFRQFDRLMGTYPNLYTDTSFGTRQILISGLEAVSRDPEPFRQFFQKYSDRILFGTDMVITGNKEKSAEWISDVMRATSSIWAKPAQNTPPKGQPTQRVTTGALTSMTKPFTRYTRPISCGCSPRKPRSDRA
jgi:predicted TIM-barrel fold metal-dependent hydrolase